MMLDGYERLAKRFSRKKPWQCQHYPIKIWDRSHIQWNLSLKSPAK